MPAKIIQTEVVTLHISHRKVTVKAEILDNGCVAISPIQDAGASDRGFSGSFIRDAWSKKQKYVFYRRFYEKRKAL
jgi:hypothetical protein